MKTTSKLGLKAIPRYPRYTWLDLSLCTPNHMPTASKKLTAPQQFFFAEAPRVRRTWFRFLIRRYSGASEESPYPRSNPIRYVYRVENDYCSHHLD